MRKQSILWLVCGTLMACIPSNPLAMPPQNSPSATATPTAVPTNGTVQPVFSLEPAAPCPGEQVNLKLVSSGFGRSQLPIALFPAPQSQPVDFNTPGGNKYPPPLDSTTVLLGHLSVSPLGTGELRFTLQNSYTTRGGQPVQINNGQRYLLYWQEQPGAFTYITDIAPQHCPATG